MKKRTFFFIGFCILALVLIIPSISAIDEWESLSGTYYQEVRQPASAWSPWDYDAGNTPAESLTTCLQYSFTEEGTKDLGAYARCGSDNGLLGESSVFLQKGTDILLDLTNTSHSYPGTFTELTWTANNLDIHQSELSTLNVRFIFSYDDRGTPTNLDVISIYNFSGLTIPDGMHLAQLNITARIRNDTSGATNFIDIDYFKVSAGYELNTFWSYSSPGSITDSGWYNQDNILIDDEDDGYTHPGGLMSSDTFRDERVQLIYNGSLIGDNKAEDGTWDVIDEESEFWDGWTFYGDSCGMGMDSFNASLTPDIVNNETFGLHFMIEQDPGSNHTSWFNVTDFSFDIPDDHDIYGCEVMVNKMNYNDGIVSTGCVKYVGVRIYHGRDAFIISSIHPDWAEQPIDDYVLRGSLPDGVRGSVPVIVRSKTQPSLDINFSFTPSTDGNESVSSFYEDDYQHMEQWDELDDYNTNYSLLIIVNNTNETQGLFLIQTGNNMAPQITMGSHHIANGTTNINLTQFASIPWQFSISDYDDTTTNITLSNGQTNDTEGNNIYNVNLLPSSLDYATNYTMWVNSTDEFGLSTNQWYWFTTRDQFIPDPPTDVSADDNNEYIEIEWTPADDTRTVIEYQNGSHPSGWEIGNQTMLYNDTGLSYYHLVGFNKTVTYVLWSYYPADNSYSNESVVVSASTPVPVYPEQPTEEMVEIHYVAVRNGTVSYTIECDQVDDGSHMIIATFPDGDTSITNATVLANSSDGVFYWYDTFPGNDTIIGFYGWNIEFGTYGEPLFISFEPFDFTINDTLVYAGGNTSIFLDDPMGSFDGDLMCSFTIDYIRDDGTDTVYHNISMTIENGTWTTVDFPLLPFWNTTMMTTNISLTVMDDGRLWGSFQTRSFSLINYSYLYSGIGNDELSVVLGTWGSGDEPFTDYHISYYQYRLTLFGESSYYYDDENPTGFVLPFVGFDDEPYTIELIGFVADYPEPLNTYVGLSGVTHDSSMSVSSPFHMNMSEDGEVSDYFNGRSLFVRGNENIRYREWSSDGSTILLQNMTDPCYSEFDEVDANPYGTNFSDYWINISHMLTNTSTITEANQTGTIACFSTSDNSTRNATHLELYLAPLPGVVYPQSGGASGEITFFIFYESMPQPENPYDESGYSGWEHGVEDEAIEVTLEWTANLHRLHSYFRVELPHRLTDIRDVWMEDAPMGLGISHLRLMDAPSGQTRDIRLYGTLNDFSIENEIRVMNGDDNPIFNFTIESRTFTEGGTTVIYPVLAFRSLLPDGSYSDEEIIPFDVLHEPMDFILSFTRNTEYGMIDTRDEVLVTFQSAYGKGQRVIEDFSYETIKEIQLAGNMDIHHVVIEENLSWYEDMTSFDLPYPDDTTIDLEGDETFLFTVDITNITPVDSGLCRLVASGVVWNGSVMSSASADWYDSDWDYRTSLEIENKIEGYQTMINLSYDDLNNDALSNFSDIRFVTENGTEIPYWIDEVVNDSFCIVWFNNIYNDSLLYIYYGNVDAVSISNISSVWDYCDIWTSDLTSEITPYQSWHADRQRTYEKNTSLNLSNSKMIAKYKIHTYDADTYATRTGIFICSDIPDAYESAACFHIPNQTGVIFSGRDDADDDNYAVCLVNREEDSGSPVYDNGNIPYDGNYHKIMFNINDTRTFLSVNNRYWTEFKNETNTERMPEGDLSELYYMSDAQDVAGYHFFEYDSSNDALDIGARRFTWSYACMKNKIKYVCFGKFNDIEPSCSLIPSMEPSWEVDYNHTYTEFMLMKDGSYQFPVDVVPGFSSYLRFEYWNETSQEWEDLMTESTDLYDGSSVHSPRSIRYDFTVDENITIDIDSPSSGSYDTDWNPDFSGSLGDNDDDKDVYLRCYMYMDSDSIDGGTLASRIENYSFTTTWLTKITEDSFDYDDYFRDIIPFDNMDYYIEYYLYDPLWQDIMLDDENYTMGHPLSCLDHGWLNITRGSWKTIDVYRHPVDYYFASTGILPVDGEEHYVSFIEDGLRMNLWNYHLRDPDYSRWGGVESWDFFNYHLYGNDILPWTIALYQEPETLIYTQMVPPVEETVPGTNDTFLVHQEESFFEDGDDIQEGGIHTHIGYQYQVLSGTLLSGRNQYHLRIGYAATVNRNTAIGGLPWSSGLDVGRDLFDSIPDDYTYASDTHNRDSIYLTLTPWRLGFLYYEHTFGTFPEGESYSELDSDSDYDQYQDSELKENVETLGELWGIPYLGVLFGLLLIIFFSVMPLFAQAYVFKGQHKRDVPLPVYGVFMFIGVGLSYSFGFIPLWVIAISVSLVGIFTIWHVMRRTGHAPVLFTDRMVYNKGNKTNRGGKNE